MREVLYSRVVRVGEVVNYVGKRANVVRLSASQGGNQCTLGFCDIVFSSPVFSGSFIDAFACFCAYKYRQTGIADWLTSYYHSLTDYLIGYNGQKNYCCEIGLADFTQFSMRINGIDKFDCINIDFIYDSSLSCPKYVHKKLVYENTDNEVVLPKKTDSLVVWGNVFEGIFLPCRLTTDNGVFDGFNQVLLPSYHHNSFDSVFVYWKNIIIPDTQRFTLHYGSMLKKVGRVYYFE